MTRRSTHHPGHLRRLYHRLVADGVLADGYPLEEGTGLV